MTARQCIATLCFVALLPSCTGWATPQTMPPGPDKNRVRVTTLSGERVVLRDPFTAGQDYAGRIEGAGAWRAPLDSIGTFEMEEFSPAKTILFSAVLLASVVGLGYALLSDLELGPPSHRR